MDRRPSMVRMPAGNNGIVDAGIVAGAPLALGMAQSETRARALAEAQAAAFSRELERMRQNQLPLCRSGWSGKVPEAERETDAVSGKSLLGRGLS